MSKKKEVLESILSEVETIYNLIEKASGRADRLCYMLEMVLEEEENAVIPFQEEEEESDKKKKK